MEGNRRIFYDKVSGELIQEIGRTNSIVLPTIERDIESFPALSERNRSTFDVIELPFGQYAQDFAESNGYHVNIDKLRQLDENRKYEALEFSRPDPNNPSEPPVMQEPLTLQVEKLKKDNDYLRSGLEDLGNSHMSFMDFYFSNN